VYSLGGLHASGEGGCEGGRFDGVLDGSEVRFGDAGGGMKELLGELAWRGSVLVNGAHTERWHAPMALNLLTIHICEKGAACMIANTAF